MINNTMGMVHSSWHAQLQLKRLPFFSRHHYSKSLC